jgi:hypothetical protein
MGIDTLGFDVANMTPELVNLQENAGNYFVA